MKRTDSKWEGDVLIHTYDLDGVHGQIVQEPDGPSDLFAEGEYVGTVAAPLPLATAEAELESVLRERAEGDRC